MTRTSAWMAVGGIALALAAAIGFASRDASRGASGVEPPTTQGPAPAPVDPLPAPALAARPEGKAELAGGADARALREILGRVVREDGGPIAAATVVAVSLHDALEAAPFRSDLPRTLSAADGTFRLSSASLPCLILAWAPGYAAHSQGVDRTLLPVDVILRREAGRITGTVRGDGGRPVADARVLAGQPWKGCGFGSTSADGTFSVPRGEQGPVSVAAWAPGYLTAVLEVGRTIDRVDLVLVRGSVLRGRVLDAVTGEGLPGAAVASAGELGEAVLAGPRGEFEAVVDGEQVAIDASAAGHAPGTGPVVRTAGASPTAEVRLVPYAEFTGVVLDEQGAPLPGAQVFVLRGGRTTSGEAGRFRVQGPLPGRGGRTVALVATAGDRMPGVAVLDTPPEDAIVLRLEASVPLLGQVVDASGAPRPRARVTVQTMGGPHWREGINPLEALVEAEWGALGVPVDGEGRFRVPGLPEGLYEVRAWATRAPGSSVAVKVEIQPGQPLNEVRIVVEDGSALSGTVVDDAGQPVPDATIQLAVPRSPTDSRETESDGEGRFRFDGAPTRPVGLTVSAPGHKSFFGEVDPHEGDVHIVLRKHLAVRWRLRLDGQVPPDGTTLRVMISPRGGLREGSSQDGTVVGAEVAIDRAVLPGEYEVSVLGAAQYSDVALAVVPAAGGEVVARLRLFPALSVAGVVRDSEGAALSGAALRAIVLAPIFRVENRTSDREGRFSFGGLQPGSLRLTAMAEGRAPTFVETEAGKEDLVIRLDPIPAQRPAAVPPPAPASGASIAGRVLTSSGQPVFWATILVVPATPGIPPPAAGRTDEAGRFTIPGLDPGSYRLDVVSEDGRGSVGSVAAGTQGLEIRVVANGQIRGRVRVPEGEELGELVVRAFTESGTPWAARLQPEGRFVVDGVSPGTYRIVARAGAFVGALGLAVTVREGEIVRDVVVELERGGVLEGQVKSAAGGPVVGAEVGPSLDLAISPDRVKTDAEGRFRIEGLSPGAWHLYVYGGGMPEILRTVVQVGSGRTTRVDLVSAR